jgi:phage terminase Nu1 subunit (DNA packaging protein)
MSATTTYAGPEPWLPKAAIAKHYAVSVRTVERWMYHGCPSELFGSFRRFRLSEVEQFLARHLAEGGR